MHSEIFTTLDLNKNGKSLHSLNIPYSINRSPYYRIQVPLMRIKNGSGPRILLMAGNHGDEYEGCICLRQLVSIIKPDDIKGELTILPYTNFPAVMKGQRRSYLDNGNLNRSFPGESSGEPTKKIAYYLEHHLFNKHDIIFDIHSGGSSMEHLAMGLIENYQDGKKQSKALDILKSMQLEYAFIAHNGYNAPTSMAAANRAGAIGISGEFGGGATVTVDSMRTMRYVLDNFLNACNITQHRFFNTKKSVVNTKILTLQSFAQSIYADKSGWFEPAVKLGDRVSTGQLAGWYYDVEDLQKPAEELTFSSSGIVMSRRLHTHCLSGDCLLQVGIDV